MSRLNHPELEKAPRPRPVEQREEVVDIAVYRGEHTVEAMRRLVAVQQAADREAAQTLAEMESVEAQVNPGAHAVESTLNDEAAALAAVYRIHDNVN